MKNSNKNGVHRGKSNYPGTFKPATKNRTAWIPSRPGRFVMGLLITALLVTVGPKVGPTKTQEKTTSMALSSAPGGKNWSALRHTGASVQPETLAALSLASSPFTVEDDLAPAGETNATQDPVFQEFNSWMTNYVAASADRKALEISGRTLAAQRRQALAQLIEKDPEESLRQTVPATLRQSLPASIVDQLEERVSGRADLSVIASLNDQSAPANPPIKRYVTMNGQTYRAFVYGRRLTQPTQSDLPIHGIAVGDVLAVHQDPVRPLEVAEYPVSPQAAVNANPVCPISGAPVNPLVAVDVGGQILHLCCGEHAQDLNQVLCTQAELGLSERGRTLKIAQSSSWTTGVKTVLFMRVSYSDQTAESISSAAAADLMSQVDAFFQTTSFGLASLQTTVTPVLALPGSVAWYTGNEMTLLGDARRAALAAGYNSDDYDLDAVFCGNYFALNQAFIRGKGAWLSRPDAGTMAHEFGHNFGLSHANAWVTTDGTSIGTGQNQEYGNFFDTMGYGQVGDYSFNAYEKHLLNWLPEDAVQTTSTGGVFRLSPIDTSSITQGLTYAIRVPKDDRRDYWIETRQRPGDAQLANGVLVAWSPWADSNGGSELLNCNPQAHNQAALQIGQDFYDTDIGLKIVPLQRVVDPDSSEPAIDVEIDQVFFLPLEISFPQTDGARPPQNLTALKVRNNPVTAPIPAAVTASRRINIPVDGAYALWMQAVDSKGQLSILPVTIMDDQGQTGTILEGPADDSSPWNQVRPVIAGADSGVQARLFAFTSGPHTIQVQASHEGLKTVRLLVTNDRGTNLPPVLSEIPDQVLTAGDSLSLPFFIAAVGQSAADCSVRVACADQTLLGSDDLTITGTGSGRALLIRSQPTHFGKTQVTLTVTDPRGRLFNQSFFVSILGQLQSLISNALPGSTVQIPAGTNYDNVTLDKDLVLEGAGIGQTFIDGRGAGVGLTISSNSNVTIRNLTIQNGQLSGLRNYGTLHVVSSAILRNAGSGLENHGVLNMESVVLRENRSGSGLNNFGSAHLQDCEIASNTAGAGGGILNHRGAELVLENGCVASNRAQSGNGGGIQNAGDLTLQDCTLYNNVTSLPTGSESGQDHVIGGAIYNTGQLTLKHCTICRNQADWEGGGIVNKATANLSGCILAGNKSLNSAAADAYGNLTSGGYNLIQNTTGWTLDGDRSGNILGQDPRLGAFGDYGGATETVALLPGSPAIDAGDCSDGLSTDQRGFPRPVGPACDIGAFEFQQ